MPVQAVWKCILPPKSRFCLMDGLVWRSVVVYIDNCGYSVIYFLDSQILLANLYLVDVRYIHRSRSVIVVASVVAVAAAVVVDTGNVWIVV